MSQEHAVTVYLPDALWATLQTTARQERTIVPDVIVETLTQAFTFIEKAASKRRPTRFRSHPEFGRRLQAARERRGWTLAALARRATFDASLIGRYERNERAPALHTVRRLAQALQLNTAETLALYRAAGFAGEVACAG
jgi:ribosome-binding protein aMBF1 (putative translation factor)